MATSAEPVRVHVVLPAAVLARSPSQAEGVSATAERAHRFFGCELVQEASALLRLPQTVAATAQTLLQRFYWRRSLREFDAFRMAAASLFLAAKSEERPRRARELLAVFYALYRRRKWQRTRAAQQTLDPDGATYARWREWLLRAERQLLIDLGFSVYTVTEHPHKFILYYVKVVGGSDALAQRAWGYVNDSLRTDLCVRQRAEVIACAAIFLAARVLQVKLPDDPYWYALFGVTRRELYETSIAIMELYKAEEKVVWLEPLTEVNPFAEDSDDEEGDEEDDEEDCAEGDRAVEKQPKEEMVQEEALKAGVKQVVVSPDGPETVGGNGASTAPQAPPVESSQAPRTPASENAASASGTSARSSRIASTEQMLEPAASTESSRCGRDTRTSSRSRSRSPSRDRHRRARDRSPERRRRSRSRSSDRRRQSHRRRRRSHSRSRSRSASRSSRRRHH